MKSNQSLQDECEESESRVRPSRQDSAKRSNVHSSRAAAKAGGGSRGVKASSSKSRTGGGGGGGVGAPNRSKSVTSRTSAKSLSKSASRSASKHARSNTPSTKLKPCSNLGSRACECIDCQRTNKKNCNCTTNTIFSYEQRSPIRQLRTGVDATKTRQDDGRRTRKGGTSGDEQNHHGRGGERGGEEYVENNGNWQADDAGAAMKGSDSSACLQYPSEIIFADPVTQCVYVKKSQEDVLYDQSGPMTQNHSVVDLDNGDDGQNFRSRYV